MSEEELENLKEETDELEHGLVSKQNIYIEQLKNKIRELEDRLEVQTICGYPIEEAIQILSAVTIERAYDIKVTMSNLKKIVELYQKEQTEMFHYTYEMLALNFGYETRKDTKKFDFDTPNGKLMYATVEKIISPILEENKQLKDKIKQAVIYIKNINESEFVNTEHYTELLYILEKRKK